MNEIASIFQALSLDNSERTITKLGLALLPLSYTTFYLLIPKFGGLDFITQAMLSLSLVILISVVSLILSNIFDVFSENYKGIFAGVFFTPSFVAFGITLICEAFGVRQNLQSFIIQLAGSYFAVFLFSFYLAHKIKKEMKKIIASNNEKVCDDTGD